VKENTMGKLVISENATIDGVIQDPTGTEGFRLAGWFDLLGASDREAWAKAEFEEALAAEALLLGRRTYEWLIAQGWTSRTGGWADRLRELPKYVVSSTLGQLGWSNTILLDGDLVSAVEKLKQEVTGDIVVNGSGQLAHALIEHDLADEFRLMICPVALGAGTRLFGHASGRKRMRLAGTATVGDSLVRLTYQLVRDA
jgi:dihydrofolate reductase